MVATVTDSSSWFSIQAWWAAIAGQVTARAVGSTTSGNQDVINSRHRFSSNFPPSPGLNRLYALGSASVCQAAAGNGFR